LSKKYFHLLAVSSQFSISTSFKAWAAQQNSHLLCSKILPNEQYIRNALNVNSTILPDAGHVDGLILARSPPTVSIPLRPAILRAKQGITNAYSIVLPDIAPSEGLLHCSFCGLRAIVVVNLHQVRVRV